MKSLSLSLVLAGAAVSHFSWIAPLTPTLAVGAVTKVQFGTGHALGTSESALPLEDLKAFVLTPSGGRVELEVAKNGLALDADYAVKETGQHRLVFSQERGARSRTPRGVKDGGRDKNPDATQSFRTVRTAVAYAFTTGAKMDAKAAGIAYELVPERTEKAITVTLLRNGKPCPGGEVAVSWAGKKEVLLGNTGTDGKRSYTIPAGAKGAFVVLAEQRVAAAKGANYDTDNYETALYLSW